MLVAVITHIDCWLVRIFPCVVTWVIDLGKAIGQGYEELLIVDCYGVTDIELIYEFYIDYNVSVILLNEV